MLLKIFFLIIGFFLMVIGSCYILVYTNLLSFGYTIGEYFSYIATRYECLYFIIGLIIEIVVVFRKEKKNVKRIWYFTKFIV